jgi:hypothetical protein
MLVCHAKRTGAQSELSRVTILIINVSEIATMTVTSRCNHPGPLAKPIPTRPIPSLFARLLRKR